MYLDWMGFVYSIYKYSIQYLIQRQSKRTEVPEENNSKHRGYGRSILFKMRVLYWTEKGLYKMGMVDMGSSQSIWTEKEHFLQIFTNNYLNIWCRRGSGWVWKRAEAEAQGIQYGDEI